MPSDSFKIGGHIEHILEPRQGGNKTFQTVVIKTEGQYSQLLPIEFGEKCLDYIEKLSVGQWVDCEFSLRGREWNGRYLASLAGFKIFGPNAGDSQPRQQQRRQPDRQFSQPAQRDYKLADREPNGRRSDREPVNQGRDRQRFSENTEEYDF